MKPSQCNFSGLEGGEQRRSCPPAAILRSVVGGRERGKVVVMVRAQESSPGEKGRRGWRPTLVGGSGRSHLRAPIVRTPDCPGVSVPAVNHCQEGPVSPWAHGQTT